MMPPAGTCYRRSTVSLLNSARVPEYHQLCSQWLGTCFDDPHWRAGADIRTEQTLRDLHQLRQAAVEPVSEPAGADTQEASRTLEFRRQ